MGPFRFQFGHIYTADLDHFWVWLMTSPKFTIGVYKEVSELFIGSFSNLHIYILPPWMYLIYTKFDKNWSITFEMRSKKEVRTSNIQKLEGWTHFRTCFHRNHHNFMNRWWILMITIATETLFLSLYR